MSLGISAATWVALGTTAASAGASIYGANQSASAAKRGSNAAIGEQQRQFDAAMALQRPYSVTGTAALNQLAQLYGLPYAPYQDPTQGYMGGGMSGGSGGSSGGQPKWADPLGLGINASDPLGLNGGKQAQWYDPIGLSSGGTEPNFQWDAGRGVVDVNGRSGGIAGGYINPQTGEVWVATPGTKNRDAALSDAATNFLRTGEGDMSNPALRRFADAIGSMGQNGYKYTAPQTGTNADGTPSANGITTPSGPSMAGFFASPDYTFRRDEGMRGLERSAAARGGAFSGNAIRGLTDFNSNLAAGEYGSYFNRLASIAGIGQTAANNGSQMSMANGNNISNLLNQQGQDRASGIAARTSGIAGALNNGMNMWSYFNQPRTTYPGTPPYSPYNSQNAFGV